MIPFAFSHRTRTAAWTLGVAAVAASCVVFSFAVDLGALAATWRSAASAPEALVAALACYSLAFLVRAVAWSRVVPALSLGAAVGAIHVSLAGNHVLPLRLGEALRITSAVRRGGIPVSTAAASTVMLRGADLVAALGLAALLGPQVFAGVAGEGRWLLLVLGAGIWAGGFAWLRRLARTPRGAGLRPSLALVSLTATSAWVLESVLVWQAARWAGLELGPADAVAVTAATIAAQALAVAPGGLGTYEAAATAALVALGADTGDALAAALTAHALATGYALLGGAAALLLEHPDLSRSRPPAPSSEAA